MVICNDALADRQPEASALTAAATSEEGLEQVSANFIGHSATVVGYGQFGRPRARGDCQRHFAAVVETVERVSEQIEYNLLDFPRVDDDIDRRRGRDVDVFVVVLSDVAHDIDHVLHDLTKVGRGPLGVADTR